MLILILTISAAQLHAQTPTAQSQAERIDRHYNALHSLSVHFTQKYDGMGMHRQESGTLLLKKPGKMRWTYNQPAGKLFVLDGDNAYFYSPGDMEIPRVTAKKLDDLRSPLRFLLGHTQLAKELTNLQINPAENGAFTLSGIPKNMEQRIASFTLTASAAGVIQSMRIEETDGAINLFTFSDEQPNAPATDADFVFHAPAGTHIIEGMPPV
ncbi:outer membrane lipoprotein carrier protein LolA [Alloacidobacterium dinghuense]|uniref:Outer membrane lipoprotein carrier protein LolA n=1 Tax=Alloacidobacterium dinghuense TaxID=2763107 RepID=A0A7G8BR20_9BACT|nr:outer membrane lipoprotein carrier protein LolA [Alloacidobacterium dinghuense]